MVWINPELSKDQITQALMADALEVWGQERADALRSFLEEAANNLWLVAQSSPDREEEPAFFL